MRFLKKILFGDAPFGLRTASDVVVERQLRELQKQLPRNMLGIGLCSVLVGFLFIDVAPTTVIVAEGVFLSFMALRIHGWSVVDVDALTPDQQRRTLESTLKNTIGLAIFCSCVTIYLSQFASREEWIILALFCAFCGVSGSISLAAWPRAAITAAVLCTAPICTLMLISSDPVLVTLAAFISIILAVVQSQVVHIGNLISQFSIRENLTADAALQAQEKLRQFIEHADDCAWERDVDGRITYMSPQFAKSIGRSASELLGKSPEDLALIFGPEDAKPALERALAAQKPFKDITYFAKRKDGSTAHFATSGIPQFDRNGEFTGFIGWTRNITDQVEAEQRLRQSEARYRDFAESAGDWAWEVDDDL
ncbi:MAG: PAS domain-containing protein, partial [Hyphococcus sp.]